MSEISTLIEKNRKWSRRMTEQHPEFFTTLAQQQSPEYLWIGCSDSRVPANDIVGLLPGELFVHRNVANLVYASDINALSVVAFAVNALKVKHIIVCGHYGCGGVRAALDRCSHGVIDHWLSKIKDPYVHHQQEVDSLPDEVSQLNRMCELNVIDQVETLSHTTIVQDAWAAGRRLAIHGWIYGLDNGLVKDLGVRVDGPGQVAKPYLFDRTSGERPLG